MTRHLIYGEFRNPRIAGHVVAAAMAIVGVLLLQAGEFVVTGIAFLVGGVILSIVVETYIATMNRKKRWLEVLEDGFKVIDRHGEREWRDYEIVSLSYSLTPVWSNGVPAGYQRRCRLWPTQGAVIELSNKYGEGIPDPLGDLINRISGLLREGFEQALAEGVEVRGDQWSLSKTLLRAQVGGRAEELPVHKISAVHPYDQFMGVWVTGKDEPAVSLPLDGRNVWLLPALIEPYLPPKDTDQSPPVSGLGRVIFRRKASLSTVLAIAVIGLVLTGLGIFGLVTPEDLDTWTRIGAASLGLLGLILVGAAGYQATSEFRCQEWGVTFATLLGSRQLMYRDVASFTWQASRVYTNGVYTGTNILLRFVPRPGCGSVITYRTNLKGNDAELDSLRDVISQIIAAQMYERLTAGEEVPWTKNLNFRSEGLVYRPSGFVTRGQPKLLPYDDYAGYSMNDGYFHLYEKGNDKPLLSERVGEANFFPGFFLLLMLAHAPQEAPPAS
jgi:hypothetical protein